jgi:hypothetical protein
MSALGFNCGKGRAYSEPARFARPIYKEETERVEVCLLKTGVVHLTAALSDAPANWACDAHHHEKRLARPRGSGSISNPQTDSSFMAKLLKIAKTKTVPPGQAAAFTIEGQKIPLSIWRELTMPSATPACTVADRCRKATFKASGSPVRGTVRFLT